MNKITRFFRRRGLGLVLIISLIGGLAAHTTFQSQGVRGTDDNLIFYMGGLNVFHAEALERLNDRAIALFEKKGTDPHAMMRLRLHKVSLNEYVLPGTIYYGVSRVLKTLFGRVPDLYPLFLSQSIVFGFFLTFLLTLLVLLGVFAFINRPLFIWALGLTLGLYGLSELLPLRYNSYATILMHDSLGGIFTHTKDLLLRPGSQFSPLAFTPRSNFTLLLIGLFALRWSKHYLAAYGLLLVLSYYHLSASGLVLVMLVGIDLVVRPQVFRSIPVAGAVALTTAVFLYRENMWEHLLGKGLGPLMAAAGIIILIAAIMVVPRVRRRIFGPDSFYLRVQKFLVKRGGVAVDLILISAAWVVSLVAIYFLIGQMDLKAFSSWSQAFYFWGRINGRLMTLLFPSVLFGLCILLLGRMARRDSWHIRRLGHVVFPAIVAAMTLVVVWHSFTMVQKYKVLPMVASGFFRVERALQKGTMPRLRAMGFSETLLYYAFAKSVDGYPRQLNAIMP